MEKFEFEFEQKSFNTTSLRIPNTLLGEALSPIPNTLLGEALSPIKCAEGRMDGWKL